MYVYSLSIYFRFLDQEKIVAATIHLDHLPKDDVLKLLAIIQPYDKNLEVKTKGGLNAGVVSNVQCKEEYGYVIIE